MDDKKADRAILCLSFVPVLIAITSITAAFNIVDLVYLALVGCLFIKYLLVRQLEIAFFVGGEL